MLAYQCPTGVTISLSLVLGTLLPAHFLPDLAPARRRALAAAAIALFLLVMTILLHETLGLLGWRYAVTITPVWFAAVTALPYLVMLVELSASVRSGHTRRRR